MTTNSEASVQDAIQAQQDSAPVNVDLEAASSSSTASLGDMAGAGQGQHYQPKQDILTRMECITDFHMKVPCIPPSN